MIEEDDDELDYSKKVKLNNEEMLRLLNLEEGNYDDINKEPENVSFIGIAFDALKPKMQSVHGDGEVGNLNYLHHKINFKPLFISSSMFFVLDFETH